jgi:CheY-like chemotaxis protein
MSSSHGLILLVDDDPSILLTVGDQLEINGYQVVRAQNAEEARTHLARISPDLIILDIRMPGEGGVSFLRQISVANGDPRYPVLVFTARAEMDAFFRHTGVAGFLAKTAEPTHLLQEVGHIISRHKKHPRAAPRVLLAEDEPEFAREMADALTEAGYHVTHVETGHRLVERAVLHPPDVIVLKYVLPHMNGTAVASLLAHMHSTRTIPIVLYDDSGTHTQGASHPPNIQVVLEGRSAVRVLESLRTLR